MPTELVYGDRYRDGNFGCKSFAAPAGCIRDSAIAPDAAIAANKLNIQNEFSHRQDGSVAATTETVHIVYGLTGQIQAFRAMQHTMPGASTTITVDLKDNGTSVLASPITFTSADTVDTAKSAAIATPNVIQNDRLDVVVTVAGSGGNGTRLFAGAVLNEAGF